MSEFEKNFRAWYRVCLDGEEFSEKGKSVLRKLYDSVPKSVNFSKFIDAFLSRPTYNLEESVKWMMAQMQRLSA